MYCIDIDDTIVLYIHLYYKHDMIYRIDEIIQIVCVTMYCLLFNTIISL